ncbi:MAG: FAD-dependent oxidoreductase, partial [Candidatus Cloacimonetes bacterium]|nr:FAD-dependent oxidoreductase [Candidatus Cloacimonadota bacterium]
MEQYQVIVIGGGPGGYEAAIRLSQYNINCLLIEKERLGGVCLNWGCIPTKTLVKSAELVREIKEAELFGLPETPLQIDYGKIFERKNKIVEQLVGGIEFLYRKRKIPVVQATVTEISGTMGSYEVKTSDGASYGAKYIIIATGSSAKSLPGIAIDEQDILSSTGILKLDKLPHSLAVVGGGVIGCEFASIFATFGVQVSIVEFLPRLVALEDEEISKRLAL